MIWAGISLGGLTDLTFLQGKQNSADYVEVFENNLLIPGKEDVWC